MNKSTIKLVLIVALLVSQITVEAQVLGYTDLGLLFSNESIQGSARSRAMKNSFGALGGDLSAISINPSAGAVFSNSLAAFSIANNHQDIATDFYGTKNTSSSNHLSLSQLGGALLFFNDSDDSKIKKVAFSINLQRVYDFNNKWKATGKSIPTWAEDPIDGDMQYTILDNQIYNNYTKGKHSRINFAIAAQYGNSLFVGVSLNSDKIDYTEDSERKEIAYDADHNSVDAYESFWQEVNASGISLGLGAIYRVNHNLRIGFSYTSPTWYDLYEESNLFEETVDDYIGYYEIIYSDTGDVYSNNNEKVQAYDYSLKTPSKLIASVAYIVGKKGLINIDLSRKNFKAIRLGENGDFAFQNNEIKEIYRPIIGLAVGSEWRIKKFSLRGGYQYEQTPYVNHINSDNLKGFSLGLGYDFGSYIFDLAYDTSTNTDYYNFYGDIEGIDGADLNINKHKFLATLVIKM
jgi:hypothetical protein